MGHGLGVIIMVLGFQLDSMILEVSSSPDDPVILLSVTWNQFSLVSSLEGQGLCPMDGECLEISQENRTAWNETFSIQDEWEYIQASWHDLTQIYRSLFKEHIPLLPSQSNF